MCNRFIFFQNTWTKPLDKIPKIDKIYARFPAYFVRIYQNKIAIIY